MSDANAPAARRLAALIQRLTRDRWTLAALAEATVRWEPRTVFVAALGKHAGTVEPAHDADAIAAYHAAARGREESEQPLWAEWAALSARLADDCRAAGYSPDRWADTAERLTGWEGRARSWRPYPDYMVYRSDDPEHEEHRHQEYRRQRAKELEGIDRDGRALVDALGLAGQWVGSRTDEPSAIPSWNSEAGTLTYAGKVKQFRHKAPEVRKLLDVFQDDGWPARIDDPFKPKKAKQVMESANKAVPFLRFTKDGTAEGIRWSPVG